MNLMRLFLICVLLLGIGGGIYFAKNSFMRVWFNSGHFLHEFLAVANPNIAGGGAPAKETGSSGIARGSANGNASKKENKVARKLPAEIAANTAAQPAVSQSPTVSSSAIAAGNASANQASVKQQTGGAQSPLCSQNGQKTLSRSVLINEVSWAGVASDKTAEEWIELKNNSGTDISLDGWRMQNGNESIKIFFGASESILAGGLYLLERGSDNFLRSVKADKFFAGAIKNNDETLRLFDGNCNAVDGTVADVGADKNWPAGTAGPDYRTAERSSDLSWHTYSGVGANGIFGTPRMENSPVPVSANIASGVSQIQTQSPPPPTYYTFQLSKSGSGAGSVTSDPSGISCGSSCTGDSEDFVSGTAVSLNALAANGSEFAGWSGDCSGTGACSVSMISAKSVSAAFNQVAVSAPPSPPPQTAPSSARSNVNHIVISQVQIAGTKADNDFIELYNPLGTSIDISEWKLRKKTQSGTESSIRVFPSGSFIQAYGYFIWANSIDNFSSAIGADSSSTPYLTSNNSIAFFDGGGSVVDALAWGIGHTNPFVEGGAFSVNPEPNQSIARKSWQGACVSASFVSSIGNGCDTNNNASDFELTPVSHPRNSQSR